MGKKQDFIKSEKQARTIKVKTMLIGITMFVALVGAFVGGWFVRSDFDSTIRQEVSSTVRDLSSVKTQE